MSKSEVLEAITVESVSENKPGIFERFFTQKGVAPFDEVTWVAREASISSFSGEKVFEQKDLMFPDFWSQTAVNIVASKYFYGPLGKNRESDLRQLISRVTQTITGWGLKEGYFINEDEAQIFQDELTHLLLHQKAAFNSPVWFNCGVVAKPQCSACFILSVEDSMESILELGKTEGMLFKWGSGSGVNLSTLRSSKEKLSAGGQASGPVSFMRGLDAFAGVIKSGGKTRRAAKMVILNVDHPDIVEFIECKAKEEQKAWKLIDAGYDGSMDGEAYNSVFFQNGNNSVRVSDAFMKAVIDDQEWTTTSVVGHKPMGTYRARDLMKKIAEATHLCGDPGLQYDDTMNYWNTCAASARINASNPCSEFVFLDNTACNLASLNLMKFRKAGKEFDIQSFQQAVAIMITAQEIIVGNAGYPTAKIEKNSHQYRPLGLGYANLGALLMARGLPYDSDAGHAYAGAVTALLGGFSYQTSAKLSARKGAFKHYAPNAKAMMKVMGQHYEAAQKINDPHLPAELKHAAAKAWEDAIGLGKEFGYRNAQVTVLAPTGTIGFMMDCDTTGIEPDIALVKYKKMVGGGVLKIVNQTVPEALHKLGYSLDQSNEILAYIDQNDGIEGAPHLKTEHLPVFDCAFKAPKGERYIHYMGHIRMMAAVQPFISGAISKTVNMPKNCSIEDISQAYIQAWQLGVKCVAIYREGSKRTQPLNTSQEEKKTAELPETRIIQRRKLKDERQSITHKFSIAGHEGYLTVGLFEDGTPGEIFVRMAKEGSTVSGLMDSIATCTSIMLQYGVPLEFLANKFSHTRFEPQGMTYNRHIPFAKSVIDYIFRYLAYKFLPAAVAKKYGIQYLDEQIPLIKIDTSATKEIKGRTGNYAAAIQTQEDAPSCHNCGALMIRSGSCYKCLECGETSGCS